MKHKNFLIAIVLSIFTTSYLLPHYGLCLTKDEETLSQGIKYIDVLYETAKGKREFSGVTKSKTAPLRLKVRAYFWLAFTHMFEGNVEEARTTLIEMFKTVSDPSYDFTENLSQTIIQNEELMNIYKSEKKMVYKGEPSSRVSSKGPPKFESSKRIISEGREMFRDLAIEEFKKVIKSEESPIEQKVSAYFWLAYTYLLEEDKNESYNIFKSMLDSFKKPHYDYLASLDTEIVSNKELIGTFEQTRDVYIRAIGEKGIRRRNRDKGEKKFTKKLIPVLLAIGYVAVIGMAIEK